MKKNSKSCRTLIYLSIRLLRWMKVKEWIAFGNQWATLHPQRMVTYTIGTLFFLLVAGIATTFLPTEPATTGNVMNSFEDIEPMMSQLQVLRVRHRTNIDQYKNLIERGKQEQRVLDSLIAVKHKSHEDSVRLAIAYRRLEIITNNIKEE